MLDLHEIIVPQFITKKTIETTAAERSCAESRLQIQSFPVRQHDIWLRAKLTSPRKCMKWWFCYGGVRACCSTGVLFAACVALICFHFQFFTHFISHLIKACRSRRKGCWAIDFLGKTCAKLDFGGPKTAKTLLFSSKLCSP